MTTLPIDNRALEREKPEPREVHREVPIFMLVAMVAVAGFGSSYLSRFDGRQLGWSGDMRTPQIVTVADPASLNGEQLYRNICAACHQTNGQGVAGVFPPLAGSPWATDDPETPVRIVLLGLQGEIEVKGETYRNIMPGLRSQLDDAQVAKILTHVRSSWGNDASAVDADLVKRLRDQHAGRGTAWNGGAELQAQR